MHLLEFNQPLLNAAGSLGFAPDKHGPVNLGALGAFFTNPISRRPRRGAEEKVHLRHDAKLLLDSGQPNPGLSRALRHYGGKWARAPLPVVVHFMVEDPAEVRAAVERIERLENILAIELGFFAEVEAGFVNTALRIALGEKPIIVRLQLEQVEIFAKELKGSEAAAISLGPPREAAGKSEQQSSGYAYGPALFERSLEAVSNLAALGLPVIGSGGVYAVHQAAAMLTAGAIAVQLDTLLWRADVDLAEWNEELSRAQARS